jgi:hypothetical protein
MNVFHDENVDPVMRGKDKVVGRGVLGDMTNGALQRAPAVPQPGKKYFKKLEENFFFQSNFGHKPQKVPQGIFCLRSPNPHTHHTCLHFLSQPKNHPPPSNPFFSFSRERKFCTKTVIKKKFFQIY